MSEQKPRTLTLRRLEMGETFQKGDEYYVGKRGMPYYRDVEEGLVYREVSPIPEGYEACDLADATRVLIGDGFRDIDAEGCMEGGDGYLFAIDRLKGLGVLAIRPIPGPEPIRGEVTVQGASSIVASSCFAMLPAYLIGKTIRWEEVVKDGGE